MTEWKRRELDRAEAKVLKLEAKLLVELNKSGTSSFEAAINLAHAYVSRARERVGRNVATKEDLRILEKVDRK